MKFINITHNKKILISTNIISIIIIIILATLLIIFLIEEKNEHHKYSITHDKDNSYILTNPILDCDFNSEEENSTIISESINKKVTEIKSKYSLGYISLYFRDLNNGPWVGVNEKEVFSPASLLKVPVLIAFLHQAEFDPTLLDKKVIILPEDVNEQAQQNITFDNSLVIGKEYTLMQVAEAMITKSDNTAVITLLKYINKDYIKGIFRTVGVPYIDTNSEVDVLVKDYAGFFRVLFNSSFLSREMSEKALEILTKGGYNDGLVAGVPKNIKIAHKFGERNFSEIKNDVQLHDCGIIYYPGKPYILCVMTRGSDLVNQGKAIKDLSSYVYNEINKSDSSDF
jgi:beta-lactamase class A